MLHMDPMRFAENLFSFHYQKNFKSENGIPLRRSAGQELLIKSPRLRIIVKIPL